jgi:eukaryotic-like serine/threonine-protein kinase
MATSIIGETIGRYQIMEEIGRGGLAVVYRAVDTLLQRNVAVKMILPDQQQTDKFLKRFNREAKTLAGLSHPSIVKVLDYGEHGGTPYLVMEYIPGGTLSNRMGKAYSYTEAAAILAPIAHALHHAHQHKVVHRDVKPANILVNESGQPMLSDFGIVKLTDTEESQGLTATGVVVGTPAYMAPEQIQGKQIDGRADIYALGIVFFELITGRKPYVANTPIELTLKHLNDPIPRPRLIVRDLPPEVEQIVMKSMAKKPEDRYQDMAHFAAVLERLAAGQKGSLRLLERPPEKKEKEPTGEKPRPAEQAAARKKGLNKGLVFGIGGAAVLVAAGLVFGLVVYPRIFAKPTPTPAEQPVETVVAGVTVVATTIPEKPTDIPAPVITDTPNAPVQDITLSPTPTVETPQVVTNIIGPENANKVSELLRLEKISVIQLDWTRDGKWIVDAGTNRITLVDPASMKGMETLPLGNDIPIAIALTSDSQQIYVLVGNVVTRYNLADKKAAGKFTIQGGANSMALTADDKTLALGMLDNKVLLINAETGTALRSLRSNYGGWAVAFSPDGKWVAAGTSQGALMWDTETGFWQSLASGKGSLIRSLVFSHDGKLLAGGSSGTIYIWDVATGDEVGKITAEFGDVNSLQFSPDDRLLASGTTDFTVRLWDTSSWKALRQLKNHVSEVFSVVFSPTGDRIASGANEGNIRLWGIP